MAKQETAAPSLCSSSWAYDIAAKTLPSACARVQMPAPELLLGFEGPAVRFRTRFCELSQVRRAAPSLPKGENWDLNDLN